VSVEGSRRRRLLVVDDEQGVRESLRVILQPDYELSLAASGQEALESIAAEPPDCVLLDVMMPGMDGMQTLERVKADHPWLPVVMVTASTMAKTAVTAIKLGAFDYVEKPFDGDELRIILGNAIRTGDLEREVDELRAEVGRRYQLDSIVGRSAPMQDLFKTVSLVAPRPTTVLITGESGTGKELIARAIHRLSPRADKPMTALNCAAIPEALLESELFGHEKGAFTGADARKQGQFELTDKGTIFLDEIGELHPAVQAKLLRVIEYGEFRRVGGTREISVDVRVIAATNRELEAAITDGSFRTDLFYRLNVVSLHLPPLRDRREDIPALIRHFSVAKAAELGISERAFSPEAVDLMLRYRWPGNVRELENLIERLFVLAAAGPVRPEELPETMRRASAESHDPRTQVLLGLRSLQDAVDEFERDIIERVLRELGFNQTRAAARLGTSRRILKYRMDKLGIAEHRG
jgi:DNA-binding NtrC family response regulator